MSGEFLRGRRVALEEAFFARENEILRKRLLEMEAAKLRKQALSTASGITDDAVLEKLIRLNIGSDTLAALALVPLIAVAWADGTIDDEERAAVFARAADTGLSRQDVSHRLFEAWLAARPSPELLAAWKDYIVALSATLSEEARDTLKAEIMTRAREVAAAAGGFLRIGRKISAPENNMLIELDRTFGR